MWFVLLMSVVTVYGVPTWAKVPTFKVTADQQLVLFKKNTSGPIGYLTTSAGAKIESHDFETINTDLINDEFFMDSITRFDRERIPERVAHAKGAGAFGHFEVTHDVTHICNAKLFNAVGKKTPVAVRFSPVFQRSGGSDTSREVRGFAVKFYTEDGNFDLLNINVFVFLLKDPIFFMPFIRSFKYNPQTNVMMDPNSIWDYLTQRPEAMHMNMLVFGDSGVPDGYRHMPGFAIHPFQVYNDRGETSFVKFQFMPDAGVKTLTTEEAIRIRGEDPDYATRDLFDAIVSKKVPTWTLSIQVLSLEEAKNATFDVFDITKVWPEDQYKVMPIGRLVLNQNPTNHFAEIEQLAFTPSNLVPGILGGVDTVFAARRISYRDSQLYRLGSNFNKIAVNCPLNAETFTYNRDGRPPVKDNERNSPNYYPNAFNGPVPYKGKKKPELFKVSVDPDPNNFEQARYLYEQVMSEGERRRMIENILLTLRRATKSIQDKAIRLFAIIHPDFSNRVYKGLLVNTSQHFL